MGTTAEESVLLQTQAGEKWVEISEKEWTEIFSLGWNEKQKEILKTLQRGGNRIEGCRQRLDINSAIGGINLILNNARKPFRLREDRKSVGDYHLVRLPVPSAH